MSLLARLSSDCSVSSATVCHWFSSATLNPFFFLLEAFLAPMFAYVCASLEQICSALLSRANLVKYNEKHGWPQQMLFRAIVPYVLLGLVHVVVAFFFSFSLLAQSRLAFKNDLTELGYQ